MGRVERKRERSRVKGDREKTSDKEWEKMKEMIAKRKAREKEEGKK